MSLSHGCRVRFGAALGMLALLGIGLHTPVSAQVDNSMSTVGTNFWFMYDNQYTWPFVDFFKQSRVFWSSSSSQWDDGRALTLDTNGYPTSLLSGQYAATLIFWDGDAHYPAGDYVLLYDGQGTVQVDMAQGATIRIVSTEPGRIVVNVPSGIRGLRIRIMATTPGNHVRNIRFIAPGFEQTYQTQIFHPLFLERLKEMRCLRFMDWMKANSTTITEWSQRTRPGHQTQGEGSPSGVALEYLVELCNRLNCDGWFCLPVRGSNACFRQYATYIRDNLKPCLKAYFEYGNECWNGGVQSNTGWLTTLGQSMGYSGWSAQHHAWARRMTDMLAVVDSVYGTQVNRRVRVIATQVGNTGVLDGLLHYYGGENYGDVIAVAPYFNPGGARGSTDINRVLDSLQANASRTDRAISADLAIANAHNMKIVGYEGGLDVWPASFGFTEAFAIQIRFHPRMESIYRAYLTSWRSGGGQLFNQYTFCNPMWGLMRYMDQDTSQAPAYLGVVHWIRANPRWYTETRDPCDVGAIRMPSESATARQSGRLRFERAGRTIRVDAGPLGAVVRVFGIDGRQVAGRTMTGDAGVLIVPAGGRASGCYVVTAAAPGSAPVTVRTASVE